MRDISNRDGKLPGASSEKAEADNDRSVDARHTAIFTTYPNFSQNVSVRWGGAPTIVATEPRPEPTPSLASIAAVGEPEAPSIAPGEDLTGFDLNRLERFGTRKSNARWTRNLAYVGVGAASLAAVWAALPDAGMKTPSVVSPPAVATGAAPDAARSVRVVPLPGLGGSDRPTAAGPPASATSLAALPDLPAVSTATPGAEPANPPPNPVVAVANPGIVPSQLPEPPPVAGASTPPITAAPGAAKPAEKPAHLARPPKAASEAAKHARPTPARSANRPTNGDTAIRVSDSATASNRPPGLVPGQKPNADKGFDPFFIPKLIGRMFTGEQ